MKPIYLIINFKSYQESLGLKGLRIAKAAEKISMATGKRIIIAPQAVDLRVIVEKVKLPVYSQSVSLNKPGPYTGSITMQALIDAGVNGVLINHHENKLDFKDIESQVAACGRHNLNSVVFAPNILLIRQLVMIKPGFIVFAPPELTGGPVSVGSKPDLINQASRLAGDIPLLASGGIATPKDIKNIMLAGASGVVVSSSIIKSDKPEEVINNLVNALRTK